MDRALGWRYVRCERGVRRALKPQHFFVHMYGTRSAAAIRRYALPCVLHGARVHDTRYFEVPASATAPNCAMRHLGPPATEHVSSPPTCATPGLHRIFTAATSTYKAAPRAMVRWSFRDRLPPFQARHSAPTRQAWLIGFTMSDYRKQRCPENQNH